jgi:hypothetical protein
VISSGLTLNQRVSGSSPERPTTTEAMGESHLERFGVFFGLRFERQQWFHSGYDSTDRRIACPELFRALDRASTRFSSITDLKPARSLALDDDLVHRAQFDLAKVSARAVNLLRD